MSPLEAMHPIKILLVDDDLVDVKAIKRAFQRKRVAHAITVARDGLEALDVLRGPLEGPYLILLDLNMPRMNGLEFLSTLRRDPHHSSAIVFALTTSRAEQDLATAYAHHVAGYMVKSDLSQDFSPLVDTIESYWRLMELPSIAS